MTESILIDNIFNFNNNLFKLYFNSGYNKLIDNSSEALELLLYTVLVYFIVCLAIYKLLIINKNSNNNNAITNFLLINDFKFPKHKRLLIIIAHPDDECMFFGPIILTLNKLKNCQVHILCLSNGNYEHKAKERRSELWKSCQILGVPQSNIVLFNATLLPDDPNVEWKTEVVSKIILKYIDSLDIDGIITFDRDGISQHPNHSAIYYATASLCLANLLPKECKIYTLDSINIVRKYISIFDLICTFLMSTNRCILNWNDANVIRSAMKSHKSQMKWFRWLYIYFSRFMFINSLREINLSDIELEMQIQDT